ncbi:microfibril-associated glycoprotein 4 [Procambarus clarkii]|uniref:microfibril-associated glycoprotein 4 n=1 Tax=Procambarus clarkii TaxID=6728 RepID=UPI0037448C0D
MRECDQCVWLVTVWAAAGAVLAVGPRAPPTAGETTHAPQDPTGTNVQLEVPYAALLQEMRTLTDLILTRQIQGGGEAGPPSAPPAVVQDCSTLHQAGVKGSGVYRVSPFTFLVYCNMVAHGGGWTVIQRRKRQEVQEDFARGWADYRSGFGQLGGEMWLGLEALHQLTYSASYELRVDMLDYEFGPKYALYKEFRVGPESDGYRLLATNYSGDAGDALSFFHSGRRFSTFDRDQDLARDKSCALEKEGGWWFHACYAAHLNGRHPLNPSRRSNSTEIRWWSHREQVLVLTSVEMKIRRQSSGNPPANESVTTDDTQRTTPPSSTPDEGEEDNTVATREDYFPLWPAVEVIGLDTGSGDNEDTTRLGGRGDINPWEVVGRPRVE